MKTRIYGASDDLIEIDGIVTDEINSYSERKISISASDGTTGTIVYGKEGNWEIDVKNKGDKFVSLIKAVGDDSKHTDSNAEGCSSYSDVLVLDEGIEWIKVGKKSFGNKVAIARKRDRDKSKRPSPSDSATLYDVGFEKVGNDGTMYVIAAASNGVHRWQKKK